MRSLGGNGAIFGSGLLLLTDDGSLIKRLTDPEHHLEKTYWIMVEGDPTPEKLAQIERGIPLKDYVTFPAKTRRLPDPELPPRTKLVTPHGPTAWIEIKLREVEELKKPAGQSQKIKKRYINIPLHLNRESRWYRYF